MYEKIIGLPHPKSKKHPPMPRENRAAQFAPFAALTGFDGDIAEEARLTDTRPELDEESAARLDEFMRILKENINLHPEIEIVYFKPDEKKSGGEYLRAAGSVKRIAEFERLLIFADGAKIPLGNIVKARFIRGARTGQEQCAGAASSLQNLLRRFFGFAVNLKKHLPNV